jgi:hypothetical protein
MARFYPEKNSAGRRDILPQAANPQRAVRIKRDLDDRRFFVSVLFQGSSRQSHKTARGRRTLWLKVEPPGGPFRRRLEFRAAAGADGDAVAIKFLADVVSDDFHLKSLPSNINSRLIGDPAPHGGKRDAGL